jgi:hypothetical protein
MFAVAHAVTRRLPTVATRVRTRVSSYGIYGGQTSTGAGWFDPITTVSPATHSFY